MTYAEFLTQLSLNNNRPWFAEHRAEYDTLRQRWYDELDKLIDLVSQWEPRLRGVTGKQASYRIYRDTRFSLDKTPFKTYFSACLSPRGKRNKVAEYYIHAGTPDSESLLAGGLWCPDSNDLYKMRRAMIDNIEEFTEIINEPRLVRLYPTWYGKILKSAPKGWPRDHANIDLLRLTLYGRCHELPSTFYNDPSWYERAAEMLQPLKPLIDFINYTLLDEE